MGNCFDCMIHEVKLAVPVIVYEGPIQDCMQNRLKTQIQTHTQILSNTELDIRNQRESNRIIRNHKESYKTMRNLYAIAEQKALRVLNKIK